MWQESEILFKCRGQYIGGGKLLNRRNTLDIRGMIFTAIFTLNRGTIDGGLLVRRMPVQQRGRVIDHASRGYRVAALT